MSVTLIGTTLNDQVYETIKRRLVQRQIGPGEKVSLHRARRRARRLAQPRAPRAHAPGLGGAADREVPRGYYRHAADGVHDRRRLRRPPRARAPGGRGRGRPRRAGRPAAAAFALRVDGGRGLACRLGHGERGVPRAPGRPGRQRPPLPLLPRAVREPDDAGDPGRPARGRVVPPGRARGDRGRVRGG